jgi:RNA polymerase sigma factor (sigma-70 family)
LVGNGPETSGRSAQELLEEFEQTGHQGPFEEIVRRYSGMVYQVCYSITKNAHDAEDATQAVFLTLAAQRKLARNIKYVGPWLQQVAYRTSLDMRRSHKRRVAREERAGQIARQDGKLEQAAPELGTDEMRGVLRDELDKLPTKYRLPLILHYFGGLSPTDISKEIGCKPKTLGVRLFRGRKMLRENLAGRGVFLSTSALALVMAELVRDSVADHFILSTSHAATRFAANASVQYGLTTNIVSNQVLSLVRSTGRAMAMSKLKWSVAVALLGATAVSSASQLIRHYAPVEIKTNTSVPEAWDAVRSAIDTIGRIVPRVMSGVRSFSQADVPTVSQPAPTVNQTAPQEPKRHAAFYTDSSPIDPLPVLPSFDGTEPAVAPMMVSTDATGSTLEILPLPTRAKRTVEQNRALVEWSLARNYVAQANPAGFHIAGGAGNSGQTTSVQSRSGISPAAVAAQSGIDPLVTSHDRASSSSSDSLASIDGFFVVSVGSSSTFHAISPKPSDGTTRIGPILDTALQTTLLASATDMTSLAATSDALPAISVTPEPSGVVLMGIGALSLLRRCRRRIERDHNPAI